MDPMAAAAATWLANGFSWRGQRNHSSKLHLIMSLVQMFTSVMQIPKRAGAGRLGTVLVVVRDFMLPFFVRRGQNRLTAARSV